MTHGNSRRGARTPEYIAWKGMKQRCYNINHPKYHLYGARGITVCPEWIDSFESFLAHVGKKPTPNHSLDRIRNNEGYKPGNVQWATSTTQGRNTRRTYTVEYNGLIQSVNTLAEQHHINSRTLKARLNRGIAIEQALAMKV